MFSIGSEKAKITPMVKVPRTWTIPLKDDSSSDTPSPPAIDQSQPDVLHYRMARGWVPFIGLNTSILELPGSPTRGTWERHSRYNRRWRRDAFSWCNCCCCCLLCVLFLILGAIIAVVAILASKPFQTTRTITSARTTSNMAIISPSSSILTSILSSTTTIITSTVSTTTTTSLFLTGGASDWLINGDGETGACELSNGTTHPTAWNYNGTITQIYYNNTEGDLNDTDPGPSARGRCYFCGGAGSAVTSMWQTVNMTSSVDPLMIDNQTVWFNFSAWIGGFEEQDDNAQASLTFIDQSNNAVGSTTTLGPVLAAARHNISSLLFQQANGLVPSGARLFRVMVTMTRLQGNFNDGLIDNIALVLSR